MRARNPIAPAVAWLWLGLLCPACGTSGATTDVAVSDDHDVLDTVEATGALPDISLDERRDEPACVPDCDGKICGDDGCGGWCGGCLYCPSTDPCCCVEAAPDCTGKVCGPDGLGWTCGECPPGWHCSADQSACLCAAWGKVTHLNGLYLPSTPGETGADVAAAPFPDLAGSACLDLNGDGILDNALGSLLGTLADFGVDANGELQKALADGSLHLLLDLGQDPVASPFDLNGYLGKPGANAGEYLVDPASFVDGEPMIHFAGAEIVAGKVELGPITISLGPLLAGLLASTGILPIDVTLDKVQLVGTVDGAIDDAGVAFKDGTLAGAIFKADLDKALYLVRKWCAEDPEAPVDVCGYTSIAEMPPLDTYFTWDLDLAGCGKRMQIYDANDPLIVVGEEDDCQASSFCLFWSSERAKITGLAPVAAE